MNEKDPNSNVSSDDGLISLNTRRPLGGPKD